MPSLLFLKGDTLDVCFGNRHSAGSTAARKESTAAMMRKLSEFNSGV